MISFLSYLQKIRVVSAEGKNVRGAGVLLHSWVQWPSFYILLFYFTYDLENSLSDIDPRKIQMCTKRQAQ